MIDGNGSQLSVQGNTANVDFAPPLARIRDTRFVNMKIMR